MRNHLHSLLAIKCCIYDIRGSKLIAILGEYVPHTRLNAIFYREEAITYFVQTNASQNAIC